MKKLTANKVIVPFDFSEYAMEAVDRALDIADAANIHVLHVLPEISATAPGIVWGGMDDASRIKSVIKEMKEHFNDDKYADLKLEVAFGDPGREIVEYAAAVEADLIVTASHGRTGITRLLLGSVAERITRLATCPVLVLRTAA